MTNEHVSLDQLLNDAERAAELSDEDLEKVVGGTISPAAQSLLLSKINQFRDGGTTLAEALAALPSLFEQYSKNPAFKSYLKDTTLDEITEFVTNNW